MPNTGEKIPKAIRMWGTYAEMGHQLVQVVQASLLNVPLIADGRLQSVFLQESLGVRQREFDECSKRFRELRGWRRMITTNWTDDRRRGNGLLNLEFHRNGAIDRRDTFLREPRSDCGVLAFCLAEGKNEMGIRLGRRWTGFTYMLLRNILLRRVRPLFP